MTRRESIRKGLLLASLVLPNFSEGKTEDPIPMIKPFKVNIQEEILTDLKTRLKNTRWPDEIENAEWKLGTNLSYLKELTDYWLNKFDWREIEKEINALPNFIADVDGYSIHFIHIKSKSKNPLPLILTHGWPGSFLEMLKIAPMLTGDLDFSFDLVIPSIPGFGFSPPSKKEGCNSRKVAGLWNELMHQLGYDRYGAQGGDIGAGISTYLGLMFPEKLIGVHLNYISGSYKPYLKEGAALSEEERNFIQVATTWTNKEGAYSHVHSTRPQTLSYGLNDSPVGLCAWILEKFNNWSDHTGTVEQVFTKDELLGNITLYWVTQSINSSIRIYNENSKNPLAFGKNDFVKVPVAFAHFPKELPTPPRQSVERGFNIQRWTKMPRGGHFAAMEQPELLSKDVLTFFRDIIRNK